MIDLHVEHLKEPRNAGKLKNYNKMIEAKSAYCGDMMRFYFNIEDGIIKNVSYEVFGCWAVMVSCSIMSEYMVDKSVEEIKNLTEEDLEKIYEYIPEIKRHCFFIIKDVIDQL